MMFDICAILHIIKKERLKQKVVSFPRKGVSEMSEIGAILLLIVATEIFS